MKLTAVEYFFRELENVNGYSAFYTNNYQHIDALYNEAKQMGKEQMKHAYHDDRPSLSYFESGEAFEEYYNENY